eukprot:scaffold128246_cov63-Phaeocystis_antarctica.AAC.2
MYTSNSSASSWCFGFPDPRRNVIASRSSRTCHTHHTPSASLREYPREGRCGRPNEGGRSPALVEHNATQRNDRIKRGPVWSNDFGARRAKAA